MIDILIGISIVGTLAFGAGIGFALFWLNRRYPLVKDDTAGTELANTTIFAPPSYGLRVVK